MVQKADAFSLSPSTKLAPALLLRSHAQVCHRRGPTLRVYAQQEGGDKTEVSLVDQVASEAQDALQFVGWADGADVAEADAAPAFSRDDIAFLVSKAVAEEEFADARSVEMFENDTREKLVKELLRKEIKADFGVELEDLLNPIKVVSLEKKILVNMAKMESATVEERGAMEAEIEGWKTELNRERRNVMMDGLKTVFRGQAVLSVLIGGALAFDKMPFYPDAPIAARAFGFWTMWLFTIPSLRAVKPLGYPQWNVSPAQEKKALNLAFVLTPLTTIALPFATKDPALIFTANTVIVAACYAFYIAMGTSETGAGAEVEIKGLLKYLDYGSGRERGARK